jgi:tetratricopeptide (TPR) repeat protein
MAQAAHDEFMKVLEQSPSDKVAIASLASLYLNQKKWDDAEKWYQKLAAVDPNSPIPYYSLGFIAWSKWYPAYGGARAKLGMKQEDPGPIKDKKVKEELKAQYGPVIEAGLQALDKALQIDPEYDDAMAYENLLIRERADLMDSKEEYEKQIQIADDWVQKALATKKIKAEKKAHQQAGGIVAEPSK